jgi:putative tryptophan/tyrosine transport system substrate-binding protein
MIRRREFITLLGGAAAAWPLAARAEQAAMPVVGYISLGSPDGSARNVAAFHKGLSETGIVEGQNVAIEYHYMEGRYDRLPALAADLVQRRVAAIATPGATPAALAAKAATATIPIVFGVGDDPVKLGLVASLARPAGNATGVNWLGVEVTAKRLALLHELLPNATRIAVLVNPANVPSSPTTVKDVREAAPALGLEIHVINAGSIAEIDAAFAAAAHERVDALFVGAMHFFRAAGYSSRRSQRAIGYPRAIRIARRSMPAG